ncbi:MULTISPECIES: chemotaxis protein CheC [unclassified Sporolactobacillus]|uniref:chemotaxis protein CheC n=1 Tax=unclassified Sporolactobacillus TaxID=2628533 RepID=UPI002367F930|nr:chemotaxis protein CheC [Sporolactobacillus sp. CQH2019]MDD9147042.1 chemotaxis protein CheC [Sporolactobacillus sp. CQH2019]
MDDFKRLQPAHLDLLKEVGNIGAGHAATALSLLLNKRIELKIPAVKMMTLAELLDRDTEKHVAASYIQVGGGLNGHFFMMFEVGLANRLIRELVPAASVFDGGIGKSAFSEISNILCGSYLSALSALLKVSLKQSPPICAIDMEGAILGEGLVELSLRDDSVILMDAVLHDCANSDQLKGEFLFFPAPESMDAIFKLMEGKSSL